MPGHTPKEKAKARAAAVKRKKGKAVKRTKGKAQKRRSK